MLGMIDKSMGRWS